MYFQGPPPPNSGVSLSKNEKPCKDARRPLWINKLLLAKLKDKTGRIERVEVRIGNVGRLQKPCPNIHGRRKLGKLKPKWK